MSGPVFALYARLYPVMWAFARHRGHEDPHSFVQEVFARTLPKKGWGYQERGWKPETFLNVIARNLMTDYWRKRTHHYLQHAPQPKSFVDRYPCELQHIRDAIRTLPERQRLVIFLRYWEDRSIAATAAFMGVNEGVVKALQHRAEEGLRKVLTPPKEDE